MAADRKPVTRLEILEHLYGNHFWADGIGRDLWPHLWGRGPARGGPSACAYTASCQLGRLRAAGLVAQGSDGAWFLTGKGEEFVESFDSELVCKLKDCLNSMSL
jgi:hypothetical protein